jgi:hypothetical protein
MDINEKLARWYFSDETIESLSLEEKKHLVSNCDFTIYKNDNGYYQLLDTQGANLGDIESEEFEDIDSIVDRLLDSYIADTMYGEDVEYGIVTENY